MTATATLEVAEEDESSIYFRAIVEKVSKRFFIASLGFILIGTIAVLLGLFLSSLVLNVGLVTGLVGFTLAFASIPGYCYLAYLDGAYDPVEELGELTIRDDSEALHSV